jgi:hypothetical protein
MKETPETVWSCPWRGAREGNCVNRLIIGVKRHYNGVNRLFIVPWRVLDTRKVFILHNFTDISLQGEGREGGGGKEEGGEGGGDG